MRRYALLLTLLLTGLMAAACGGGTPEAVSLSVDGNDSFQFIPASASVQAGAEVSLTFRNAGALDHSWALVPADADVNSITEASALSGTFTGVVTAGQSAAITFMAPAAGSYKYVCTVPGHAAAGMVGTLTVSQ